MGWEVHPDSFYKLLNRLCFEYGVKKILITENGCSYPDALHDPKRIDYLRGHLTAVHRAIQNGVPIAGYLQWSFMDNYEWAEGYSQRCGIVYVDYKTQKRTPKESAFWYRNVITANKLASNR